MLVHIFNYRKKEVEPQHINIIIYALCVFFSSFFFFVAADVGDTGAEFDRVFLQELRDLKVFVNDREIVEEHKR